MYIYVCLLIICCVCNAMNSCLPIKAFEFVIFSLSSLSEVGIKSCRFHATAGPGTRISLICVAQYSQDYKALNCESYNRVESRVSNERTEAQIIKFPAFVNWLSARLRSVQCICYWDTDLSWAINLYIYIYLICWIWQTLVHVMAAWGHLDTEPSVHLCRVLWGYHKGHLVAIPY